MKQFVRDVMVDAIPERVFQILTDLEYTKILMPDIVATDMLTEGEFGVGTVWRETRRFKVFGIFPMKAYANIEVSEFVQNKLFTAVSEQGNMWVQYRYTLEAAGDQTNLHLEAKFKCTGKLEGNEKKEKWLADWCEKTDGDLLDRVKAFLEA